MEGEMARSLSWPAQEGREGENIMIKSCLCLIKSAQVLRQSEQVIIEWKQIQHAPSIQVEAPIVCMKTQADSDMRGHKQSYPDCC